jgi:hypothetical protein
LPLAARRAPLAACRLPLAARRATCLTAFAAGDAVLVEIPARHFWILVHETPYFATS